MRIVIDKDCSEIQVLNESYMGEKMLPKYKVMAVEADGEKFVYAKGLKFDEATETVYDLAWDDNFQGCQAEIVESTADGDNIIWSSDEKTMVVESSVMNEKFWGKDGALANFFKGVGDKAKKALDGLKNGWKSLTDLIGKWSKDRLSKWRDAAYINKEGQLTGLGYKVATGKAKPIVGTEETLKDKEENLQKLWEVVVSQTKQALEKTGLYEKVDPQNITGIVKSDKEPVQIQAKTISKESGEEVTMLLTQGGDVSLGNGNNNNNGDANGAGAGDAGGNNGNGGNGGADGSNGNGGEGSGGGASGGGEGGGNGGDLEQRVSNIEKALKDKKILSESSMNWNFNDQQMTNKVGIERATIKRFFNELNDPSVKEIKFVSESGNVKTYETSKGSSAYADFKKDFKESTSNAVGKCASYKVKIESGGNSTLKGYKFSNFGMNDDFDSTSKIVLIKESWTKFAPEDGDNKKKFDESV